MLSQITDTVGSCGGGGGDGTTCTCHTKFPWGGAVRALPHSSKISIVNSDVAEEIDMIINLET